MATKPGILSLAYAVGCMYTCIADEQGHVRQLEQYCRGKALLSLPLTLSRGAYTCDPPARG